MCFWRAALVESILCRHGGLWGYLREKFLYYTVGFYHERYLRQVRAQFDDVGAIVFGHSHRPVNRLLDDLT